MAIGIKNEFEKEYLEGKFHPFIEGILPFFECHKAEFLDYYKTFISNRPQSPFDIILKAFIIFKNMPFNQSTYMCSQSDYIKCCIAKRKDYGDLKGDSSARQQAVSFWIKFHGQEHRSKYILKQVYCFEKVKHEVIPQILEIMGLPAGIWS